MSVADRAYTALKQTPDRLSEVEISQRNFLYAITTIGLFSLVTGPIIFFVWGSFWTVEPGTGGHFTFQGYLRLWNPIFIETITNTLIIAVGGTLLTLGLSIGLLLAVVKTNIRGKEYIKFVLIAQYLLPSYVMAFGWTFYINIVNETLSLIPFYTSDLTVYSLWGIILVGATHYAGLVYLLTTGAMESIPSDVEEAALVSGASKLRIFRRITLPLVFPSLAIAAILVITRFSQSFGFPLILGLPERIYVVATIIYSLLAKFPPDFAPAAAMGVILLVFTLCMLFVQRRVIGAREKYETIGGKSSSIGLTFDLGKYRMPATLAIVSFVTIIFVGPLVAVFFVSLLDHGNIVTFTLEGFDLSSYETILWGSHASRFWGVLWNTLWVAGLGAFLGMVLASFVSYIIVKSGSGLGAVLDFVSLSPVAIPGIIVGAAFFWLFVTYNVLGIYGTLWMLLLALTAKFIVYGTRATNGSFRSIGAELEEAAEVSGSSLMSTIRHIYIPLIRPGFTAGFIILFVDYISILSIPLILNTQQDVMSVYLFKFIGPMKGGRTMDLGGAVASLMILMIVVVYGFVYFFTDIDALKL